MNSIKLQWNRMIFLQRNRILYWLSMILILMVVIIVHGCSLPLLLPEKYFGWLVSAPNSDKTFYNIAVSYVAAYIFYIIQVYIPQSQAEQRAYGAICKTLSDSVRSMKEILYLIDNMYEIDESGIISEKNTDWFYYCEYSDRYVTEYDRMHNRKIDNGKVIRKVNRNCLGKNGLYEKCEQAKKNYRKLIDSEELHKVDINTENLIRQLDISSFCEGFFSTLNLMSKLDCLVDKVDNFNVNEKVAELNEKKIPGITFKSKGNTIVIYNILGEELLTMPTKSITFSTSVNVSNKKMKEKLDYLSGILDIDGDISFRENTSDEEKQQCKSNVLRNDIQKMFQ